jgi:hypothetical protein
MMQRHRTDFVELLFGLAFLATGGGFIVQQTTDRAFDTAWVAALALVTIGCAFLAVTLLHRPGRDAVDEPSIDALDALDTSDS